MTTQNSIKRSNDNISNPEVDNNSSTSSQSQSQSQSQSISSPITSTQKPTTTPIPKGLTIYSDLDFQGKSLFLPTGTYDKSFFDTNWTNLGIRSWKSTNADKLMITYLSTNNGGSSININVPNIGVIIGGNDSIMKEITDFNIFTPEQWKKNFCLPQIPGTTFTSHWSDIPSSTCNDHSDVKKYTSLTGNWKTPGNSLGQLVLLWIQLVIKENLNLKTVQRIIHFN